MQKSIRSRLESILERYHALEQEQMNPDAMSDHKAFERVGKEMHSLSGVVELYKEYLDLESELSGAQELQGSDDAEMAELAEVEVEGITIKLTECEQALMLELLPKDPDDDKNIFNYIYFSFLKYPSILSEIIPFVTILSISFLVRNLISNNEFVSMRNLGYSIFDIFKPGPIGEMDKMDGGIGIMMDDVVAGILTCLLMQSLSNYLL